MDISKKFPNFDNRTILKIVKIKSSENSVFRWALAPSICRFTPKIYSATGI